MSKKNKIIIAIVCTFTIVAVAIITPLLCLWYSPSVVEGEERVIAYVIPEHIQKYGVDNLNFDNVTHLVYAFAYVQDGSTDVDVDNEEQLAALSAKIHADYPKVKLMLALRSSQTSNSICVANRTAQGREAIANQLVEIVDRYHLDGIDIDWEYPRKYNHSFEGCSNCRDDHASLIEKIRELSPAETLISFAAGIRFLSCCYDNTKLKNIVDFVNVMNYDFSLDNNSPFGDSKLTTFNYLVEGYSKSQLNWGLPLYARCSNPEYDYMEYWQIAQLQKNGEIKVFENGNSTYAIYKDEKLSYDTLDMLKRKTAYAKKHGYGGVFVWNLGCDTTNAEAMNAIWDEMKG